MINDIQKVNTYWQELDIIRGLAAVLMVMNHLGNATLTSPQNSGISGSLVFIGSFAPVLFFFVTGVGYGLQSHKKKTNRWYITLNKVVVLFLADLLLRWSPGGWLGIDFFGFIGLSSLVLELLRNSKSPLAYCLGGFATISAMRYLVGPVLRVSEYDRQAWGILGWIFGTYAAPGVSYPLSPWLAYPLAGYLIGYAVVRYRVLIEKYRSQVIFGLLMLGAIPAIAGVIINRHGSSLFRWGTVSFDFYVVSFSVILASLALSLIACAGAKLRVYQNALSLQGIASFAVVPLHYFLIYLLVSLGVVGLGLLSFCLLLVAVLIVSFLLAHSVESFSQLLRRIQQQRLVWSCLVAMFLLALGTLVLAPNHAFLVMATKTCGQIVLCLLFVVRPPIFSHSLLRRHIH
ncbi:MAG: DUF1624 domain-containing protein [Chroococcidiopsidaceae cyanobacterium CP_BM_RX_35]|nr:DUF1624 domain-containing protein [Chroococcidiopsidaceae cyanobacterium CP_BM_RX_35]